MAPNSRPPLTSRIRASFEGRRKSFESVRKLSKSGRATTADSNNAGQEVGISTGIDSDTSRPLPMTGFITQDPESIQNAVDQAINGEAFQLAIAANLAKLIKPSIKSALDTIQPVVEAVYSHELLLRKTNQSVEDVLSRMDTNAESAATKRESMIDDTYVVPGSPAEGVKSSDAGDEAAKWKGMGGPSIDQFRQMLEEHNAKTLATISEYIESNNTKTAELLQEITGISASIEPTKESIDSLKSTSEQATTLYPVLQSQLDQLRADIGQIIETIGADLGKNIQTISEKSESLPDAELLSSHTTKLDRITNDLAILKGQEESIGKISTEIGVLKASVEAGTVVSAQGFADVLAAVGEQSSILNDIKEKDSQSELLAALQQSNESHALHTTVLSEIKDRSLGPATIPVVSEGGSTVDHSSALQMIQNDLTTLKENFAAGFSTDGDLSTKINKVLAAIEEHKTEDTSAEILAAVKQSNESHVGHAAALECLISAGNDVGPELGTQVAGIVSKLDEHSAALEDIKTLGGTHTSALDGIKSTPSESVPIDTSEITAQIDVIIAKLEIHTATLDEIKGLGSIAAEPKPLDTSDLTAQISTISTKLDTHAATLDDLKGLSSTHTAALESIKSVPTEGPYVDAEGITAQITAIVAKLDLHTAVLDDIKGIGGSHATALESIKLVPTESPSVDTEDINAQITAIVAKLDLHTAALDDIKSFGSSHASTLEGFKSVSLDSATTTGDLSTQITALVGKLDEHTSVLHELKEFGGAHATALENHGIALEGIKSLAGSVPEGGVEVGLGSQIANVVATLEKHSAALDDIKSHTTALESHSTTLDEIKTSTGAYTSALEIHGSAIEDIKSRTEGSNDVLGGQVSAIVATLESHSSILDGIQSSTDTHVAALESHGTALESLKSQITSAPADVVDPSALEAKIETIIITLESHSSILDEVRANSASHTSLLDEIRSFGTAHATALDDHRTSLEEIKSLSIEEPPTNSEKTDLDAQLTTLVATLECHTAALDEIRASTGSHSLVLDEIKTASTMYADTLGDLRSPGVPMIAAADPMNLAALEIQIGSIIRTLETHSAAWNEIKARNETASMVIVPNDPETESGSADSPLTNIIETLKVHTFLLNEIKEDVSAEILTSLHDMGQVQANQSNLLTEIREADLDDEILTLLHASSESHTNNTAALAKIHDAVILSNESHFAHTSSLDEIKARSVELKEATSSFHDNHTSMMSEIRDATLASKDAHASHTAAFQELKSLQATPAQAPETTDLAELEANIVSMFSTIKDQTTTLSLIKETTTKPSPEILAAIQASHELLTAQGSLLECIKESSFNTSVLTNISELKTILEESKAETVSHSVLVKDLHSETKDSHSNLASAIGALTLGGAVGAGATALLSKDDESSSNLLDEIKTVLEMIKIGDANIQDTKDKVSSLASQIETNHTAIIANVCTLSGDIKSEIVTSGTNIVESITLLDSDVKAIDISSLPALSLSLSQHGEHLKSLSSQLRNLDCSMKDNTSQVSALHSGVHLNYTGVQQLKDHVTSYPSKVVAKERPAMAEGTWFGSARSGSRSPTISRNVSRSIPQPVPEATEEAITSTDDVAVELEQAHDLESPAPLASQAREAPTDADEMLPSIERANVAQEQAIENDILMDETLAINEPGVSEPLPEIIDEVRPSIEESMTKPGATLDDSSASEEIEEPSIPVSSLQVAEVVYPVSIPEENLSDNEIEDDSPGQPILVPVTGMDNYIADAIEEPVNHTLAEVQDEKGFIDQKCHEATAAISDDDSTLHVSTETDESRIEKPVAVEPGSSLMDQSVSAELLAEDDVKESSTGLETPSEDQPDVRGQAIASYTPIDGQLVHEDLVPFYEKLDQAESELQFRDATHLLHEDEQAGVSLNTSPHAYQVAEFEAEIPVAVATSPSPSDKVMPDPLAVEHESLSEQQDASCSPYTREIVEPSSPFVESPAIHRGLDEPSTVPSLLLPAHQSFIDDRGLESGHATPRDEAQTNPFEDSEDMMSPSSALSPQSVLSPEAEINAPEIPIRSMDSIDERGLRSPDSDVLASLPTFPIFPGAGQNRLQPHADESDGDMSPTSEYDAPVFSGTRPRTPVYTDECDNFQLENFGPPPTFPTFPAAAQHSHQRFDDSDDVVYPSSEYDDPVFSDSRQRTPDQTQPLEGPVFTPAPSFPIFPEPTQHLPPQRFEDSEDPMFPISGYNERGLPYMTQNSPIRSRQSETSYSPLSPQFGRNSPPSRRGLQRESSFDYQQENFEPALLPRNLNGQTPAFEDDVFRSPGDGRFIDSEPRHRSPLQTLEDDDFRAGQYEQYSPEPLQTNQRLPVEVQLLNARTEVISGFPTVRSRSSTEGIDYESEIQQQYSSEPESPFLYHQQRTPVDAPRFDDFNEPSSPHSQLGAAYPYARETSPVQPFEDDRLPMPVHERFSPEPGPLFSSQRQYSRGTTTPAIAIPAARLELDTTAFRTASPIDPYGERDAEAVSPSSEFAIPITPARITNLDGLYSRNPFLPSSNIAVEDDELSHKGEPIASPGLMSSELDSTAQFGNNRNEVYSGPDSTLASPTSPASPTFSEGGTMVEDTGGKKKRGEKGKKEEAGEKREKKETVPFEVDGEDAE
ncbi:uncharacterized protein RAG0_14570 [Rhynchosporium agropyri]|uniref:Uncharacterized protein n=1 Tax=Rhynchosporium agropyri TaxID=914238 RepID=A0A1E1LHI1_9HELO|nr:uncharacterized protein RAG0_14570 [Rhynchosporium agropyri]